jgi:hypothetical protein
MIAAMHFDTGESRRLLWDMDVATRARVYKRFMGITALTQTNRNILIRDHMHAKYLFDGMDLLEGDE